VAYIAKPFDVTQTGQSISGAGVFLDEKGSQNDV
jgi:hypothetical protein